MASRNQLRRPFHPIGQRGHFGFAGAADGLQIIDAGAHRGAAVEDVDIIVEGKAFRQQHGQRRAATAMRLADGGAGLVGEQIGVDRVARHQIGDELVAVDSVETVRLRERQAEEFGPQRVPERRVADCIHHAAQLGNHAIAKARPVLGDEQIAGARQKPPQPASAQIGVKEQPAHFRCAIEITGERQELDAQRAIQFLASLGEGGNLVAVERPFGAHPAEHHAGATDPPGRDFFQQQQVKLVRRRCISPGEAGV